MCVSWIDAQRDPSRLLSRFKVSRLDELEVNLLERKSRAASDREASERVLVGDNRDRFKASV